jgi:hypothetical protein
MCQRLSLADGQQLLNQLLLPTTAVFRANRLKCEAGWLVVSDAGIVIIAIKMLEKPRPYVVSLAYVYPQGTEGTVNP